MRECNSIGRRPGHDCLMRRWPLRRTVTIAMLLLLVIACEKESPRTANSDGNDDVIDDTENSADTDRVPQGCGDGILQEDEACDDGNRDSGDGCSADCLEVEAGFVCHPAGTPCRSVAICGDGVVVFPEQCDDGNLENGDGCSELCQVEIGFKCEGTPLSVCTPTVCGDGIREGAEGCDDGNALPFDGCDAKCQVEPDCSAGTCTSTCGDGVLLGNEECDDGNNIDGDGCSADCRVEPGYTCTQPPLDGSLQVPVVYKDFNAAHPDFENGTMGCSEPSEGMLADTLDDDNNPVFLGDVGSCGYATRFDEWYDMRSEIDGTPNPAVVISTLTLYDNGHGGFVNRWGPDGTPWVYRQRVEWSDWIGCTTDADADCSSCADIEGYREDDGWLCDTDCDKWIDGLEGGGVQYSVCAAPDGSTPVDGNPFFFPLDGQGISPTSEYLTAATGPLYTGNGGYMGEEEALDEYDLSLLAEYSFEHNFSFTSQVRFWFSYDETTSQRLDFLGDDDVWVFVNGRLVVDLGGIHEAAEGSVDVNSLDLVHGHIYEIVVLQAERQSNGSSYRLTLSGFNTARSQCRPECGDGIVGLGEECDDGVNDGGYNKCGPNCTWEERCGDGIVQEEHGEHCDDGAANGQPDMCPRSCRHIIIE